MECGVTLIDGWMDRRMRCLVAEMADRGLVEMARLQLGARGVEWIDGWVMGESAINKRC